MAWADEQPIGFATYECSRLEWHTDRPNADAQRFYADLGMTVDDSKLLYRAQGDALRQLASG